MEGTKCTVCLIGPKGAGKSALLGTFVDCTEDKAYGYPGSMRLVFQEISDKEYLDSGPYVPSILGSHQGQYELIRNSFFAGQTETEQTLDYYFRLSGSSVNGAESAPILLRIVDSAGEFAIRESSGSKVELDAKQIDKLEEALKQADAVIFVVPLVNLKDARWQGNLTRLIVQLSEHSGPENIKPTRIVVAFTHYERLFIRLGREAFAQACYPDVARNVIRRALANATWFEALRAFENRGSKVYFTVTSAYGFAKELGNPNIDPHWRSEGRLFTSEPFGKRNSLAEMRKYWRPFLTAEPFICAALNEPSRYTFRFAEFDDGRVVQPEPEPPDESGRPGRIGALLRSLVNWLNRNRDQ
jgi:hypothetical protein